MKKMKPMKLKLKGWQIDENSKDISQQMFNGLKEAFLELKKEHDILKEAFKEMSENVTSEPGDKRSDEKNVRMLQNEMKKFKR